MAAEARLAAYASNHRVIIATTFSGLKTESNLENHRGAIRKKRPRPGLFNRLQLGGCYISLKAATQSIYYQED